MATADDQTVEGTWGTICRKRGFLECKSKSTLFGLPIVHYVSWPRKPGLPGIYWAKGVIAIGPLAVGMISIGCLAFGVLALGILAFAALGAAGNVAVAGLAASGNIAVAIGWVAGNIAVGYRGLGSSIVQWG